MNTLFRPTIFPALLKLRGPARPEPSWLIEFGWIELRSWSRPGWFAICETTYDVEEEIKRGPPLFAYTAIRRGPPIGDHCPILERCVIAINPATGQVQAVSA